MIIIDVLSVTPASPPPTLETIATIWWSTPAIISIVTTSASFPPVFVGVWFPVPLVLRRRTAETTTTATATTAPTSPTSASPSPTSVFPFWAMNVSLVSHNPLKMRMRRVYVPVVFALTFGPAAVHLCPKRARFP